MRISSDPDFPPVGGMENVMAALCKLAAGHAVTVLPKQTPNTRLSTSAGACPNFCVMPINADIWPEISRKTIWLFVMADQSPPCHVMVESRLCSHMGRNTSKRARRAPAGQIVPLTRFHTLSLIEKVGY